MLNLEFELIAILILAAVIGILMGRFLCKSGESEEREKKKKVIHAFKASENELNLSRESIKKQLLILKGQEDKIAEQEQEISNSRTKVNSSDTQRVKLLDELKFLEKYKSRFESLDREFKLQNKILDGLKEEKILNQKEIADFKILTDELNKNIVYFKEKGCELESSVATLEEKIRQERNKHEEAYEQLEQGSSIKYKEIIEIKNNAYNSLEESKSRDYKEMIDSKTEAYAILQKDLERVESEYEEFKLSYTLDNERLEKLEEDNSKIYHTLETIVLERDDLVARLRAISSVVGAVGIDRGENTQSLLENK